MSSSLRVNNHQGSCRMDLRFLGQIGRELLERVFFDGEYELEVHLVDQNQMVALNEKFLRHRGSTDVICFDYRDSGQPKAACGEIFICIDEALIQARCFRTSWQGEVVRYLAHAALHLCGYDDHRRQNRRKMKQAEDRLLNQVAERFQFSRIGCLRASGKPRRRR